MTKRLLNCFTSDFQTMHRKELLESIRNSEGRVLVTETYGLLDPLLGDVSNAELAAAMGADILLLNVFDVNNPKVKGIPECKPEDTVRMIRKLTGRPVGINLEPVNDNGDDSSVWHITEGRKATVENALKAADMGVDLIMITGNPGMMVDNQAIIRALKSMNEAVEDKVILAAGKMHAAGTTEGGSEILSMEDIHDFAEAGADIILMPAPGTVPGISQEWCAERISYIHELGKLAITSIGTSQEGADVDTIRRIALMAKMAGTDLHHIGDSGFNGIADPEDIMAYSIAIRGKRHTLHRMAASVNR